MITRKNDSDITIEMIECAKTRLNDLYTNQQKALRWKTVLSTYSQQFNIHISFGMLCWLIQFIFALIYKGDSKWQQEN